MSAETLCCPSAILCGTKPVSALTRVLFILLHSVFFLVFREWPSCADRVVNLYKTIRLPATTDWKKSDIRKQQAYRKMAQLQMQTWRICIMPSWSTCLAITFARQISGMDRNKEKNNTPSSCHSTAKPFEGRRLFGSPRIIPQALNRLVKYQCRVNDWEAQRRRTGDTARVCTMP